MKLLFSNLLLILSVNNPTHMYLSDLKVYFKVEVYFRVTWSRTDNPIQRKNLFLLDKAIGFPLSFFLKTWGRMALKGEVHGSAYAHLSKRCFSFGTCCIVYARNMIMS